MPRKQTLNQLSLNTAEGVHAFLYRWYEIGEERFRGDLSVCIARIDVQEAMDSCGLWDGEFWTFWYVYFRGYDIDETARKLGVDVETVKTRLERGCTRISEYLAERGYDTNA